MIKRVSLTRRAEKQLARVPAYIAERFLDWVEAVELVGLIEVRKRPGLHDEPLKGDRAGQRSIRLNRSWRAIYVIASDGAVQFVSVEEVTNHGY